MRIAESELIINADGSAFHVHIKPEHLADKVILVGDPGRVEFFRPFMSEIESEGISREFAHITGLCYGCRITVLSTGIGSDNIDIVMTELDALANIDFVTREVKPVHRSLEILRLGTCGAIQPDIAIGTNIFSEISIGFDGLMNWYEGLENYALFDYEEAFVEHCHWNKRLSRPYFVRASRKLADRFRDCTMMGMTVAAPGFYGPQGRIIRQRTVMPDMLKDVESFSFDGRRVTNFEMEGAAIAGIAANLGHEAATICCAIANRYLHGVNTDYKRLVREMVEMALKRMCEA